MPDAAFYRLRAAELDALARLEHDPSLHAELQSLAQAYRKLAELADRNAQTHLVYEPPLQRPVMQQQQQQSGTEKQEE